MIVLIQKVKSAAIRVPLSSIVVLMAWFSVSSAYAEEDRCSKLGAACICSEPLNTNKYVATSSNTWNPSDSVTKQCSHNALNSPISTGRPSIDLLKFSNESSILSKLPIGHKVNYILRALDGEPNYTPWKVGVLNLDSSGRFGSVPKKRLAVRFYMYHSSDFSFANAYDGESNNTKFFEGSDFNSGFWDSKGGKSSAFTYILYGWTSTSGVTYKTKSSYQEPMTSDEMKGVWLRFELIVTNRDGAITGQGTRLEMFMKDVTNGTPEVKVWDTALDLFTKGVYMGIDAKPSGLMESFYTNNWRQDAKNGIPMKGFRAISHYMLAAWDTDEGQRIGSALEVEGISGEFGALGSPPGNWVINNYSILLE